MQATFEDTLHTYHRAVREFYKGDPEPRDERLSPGDRQLEARAPAGRSDHDAGPGRPVAIMTSNPEGSSKWLQTR